MSNPWGLTGRWETPYSHQINCVVAARNVKRGYANLPCGAGKSAIVYMLANDPGVSGVRPKNVLIVGGSRSTSTQLYTNGVDNTTIGSCLEYAFEQKAISLAPPNSPRRVHLTSYGYVLALQKQPFAERLYTKTPWDLIVLDEVHQAMGAQTWKSIQRVIGPNTRVIGLTGTPYRTPTPSELDKSASSGTLMDQNSAFLEPLGACFYQISIKALAGEGLIAKLSFRFITVPIDDSMANGKYENMPATERRDVAALNKNKALAIAQIVARHRARNETGIIFIQKLACAEAFDDMIRTVPCMADGVVMVGATSEENAKEHNDRLQSALRDLTLKKVPFLILSKAYEFGIDVPNITYVAMSDGPGASVRSDTQRTGRVCRNCKRDVQKSAFVYSLSMAGTHEIHEKQFFVTNLRQHGFTDDDISTTHFDVDGARREIGISEPVLAGVAEKLLQRQEKNAGKRKEKQAKKDIARERCTLRQSHTAREQKAHPLFKSKIRRSNKRVQNTLSTDSLKRLTDANTSGREEYLRKLKTQTQRQAHGEKTPKNTPSSVTNDGFTLATDSLSSP